MPELLDKLQKQQLQPRLVYRAIQPQRKQSEQYQQYSRRLQYRFQNLQHQQKYQQHQKHDFLKQEQEEPISQQRKFYNLNVNINASESNKIIIITKKPTTTTTLKVSSLTKLQPSSTKPITENSATSTYNVISTRHQCAAIFTFMLSLVCHYSNAQKTFIDASNVDIFSRSFSEILEKKAYSNSESTHSINHSHESHPRYPHILNFSAQLENQSEIIENYTKHLESLSIVDLERNKDSQLQFIDSQPIFDFGLTRNVTGRTGQSEAIIKCRVDMLNDKSVSWIRKRDLHILTVGTTTYTTDKRFEVSTTKDEREWILHIKTPQARDSGIYECQVNTEPKISMAFQLSIIDISPDAKAIITGPPDLHFKVGSVIVLQCLVEQPTVKDIGPIYWYRGEQMITPFQQDDNNNIDYDANGSDRAFLSPSSKPLGARTDVADNANLFGEDARTIHALTNDITLDFTARIAMESQLGDVLKSRLRISNAQTKDTGNYTCQPTTANSASVMVHVINDENPAAMQKSCATALSAQTAIVSATIFFCCLKLLLASRHTNIKTLKLEKRTLDHAIVLSSSSSWLLLLMEIVTVTQTSMLLQKK